MTATSSGMNDLAMVDERELQFLILHHLAAGPCSRAFEALQQESVESGLLPTRTDIFGNEHPMTYEELARQNSHITPRMLADLLSQALRVKQDSGSIVLTGIGSLLGSGLTSLTSGHQVRPLPALNPAAVVPVIAVRETQGAKGIGWLRKCTQNLLVGHQEHQKTIRGHRYPVYCLAFDQTGRLLISGSDDRLVKMWSMQTGLLRMTCRGHEGEVTDLAVSCDNSMAASSSNDATIRVWNLQDDSLGCPVSVLLGHSAPISSIDFNRSMPEVLLSSSLDSTCCIWNAREGGGAVHKLIASPQFGPASLPQRTFGATRQGGLASTSAAAAAEDVTMAAEQAQTEATDNNEHEHTDVLVSCFSPDGSYIVAGATDCHCYVWAWNRVRARPQPETAAKPPRVDAGNSSIPLAAVAELGDMAPPTELCRLPGHKHDVLLLQFNSNGSAFATGSRDGSLRVWRRPKRRGQYVRGAWQAELTLASPVEEAAAAAARRRRRPPPSPTVNQLAWTKDDAWILAAVSDNSILVWDASTGKQRARLVGHVNNVHVLEGHPTQHSLAMSASYDGCTIVWDIITGSQLASFTTQSTRPGGGRWEDPLHLMDGHWTVDGLGIVVSDSAGQLHIYGTGSASLFDRARYDQYSEGETMLLTRDLNGHVIDTERQLPPHLLFASDRLCDYLGEAYPPSYQTAWHSGQLWQLPVAEAQANVSGAPYTQMPPAVHQFPPVLSSAAWEAQESGGDEAALQAAIGRAVDRMQQAELASAQPPQQNEGDMVIADQPAPEAAAAAPLATAQEQAAPARGVSTRQTRRDNDHADQPHSQGQEDTDSSSLSGLADDEYAEVIETEHMSRAERLELRTRRREELLAGERQRRRRRRQAKRPADEPAQPPGARKRQRSSRLEGDDDVDTEDFIDTDNDDLFEQEVRQSSRPRRAAAHYGGEHRPDTRAERMQRREATRRRAGPNTAPRLGAAATAGGRPLKAYAWLQECKHKPGVYVPQLNDDVVYVWEGHKQYMDNTKDKRRGCWTTVVSTDADGVEARMRAAEPAKLVNLEYTISDDGQANTFATVRLLLCDPQSPLQGREFTVDIPPSHLGQAEFVIERSRFDMALRSAFAATLRCKIFYPDEGEQGQWWRGTIIEDKLGLELDQARTPEESPWETALWERFTVAWDMQGGQDAGGSLAEQMETEHAAWEMFDEAATEADTIREYPPIDAAVTSRAAVAVEACLLNPRCSLFAVAPEPEECFPTSDGGGMLYYNQIVALPMSLLIIQARLQQNYYRKVEALMHDAQLLAQNAWTFNGEGSPVARLAQGVANKIIQAAKGEDAAPSEAEEDDMHDASQEEDNETRPWSNHWGRQSRRRPARRPTIEDEDDDSERGNEAGPSRPARTRRASRFRPVESDSGNDYEILDSGEEEEQQSQQRRRRRRGPRMRYKEDSSELEDANQSQSALFKSDRPRRNRKHVERFSPDLDERQGRSMAAEPERLRPRRERHASQLSPGEEDMQARDASSQPSPGISLRPRRGRGRVQQSSPEADDREGSSGFEPSEADEEPFGLPRPSRRRTRRRPAGVREDSGPAQLHDLGHTNVENGIKVRLRTGRGRTDCLSPPVEERSGKRKSSSLREDDPDALVPAKQLRESTQAAEGHELDQQERRQLRSSAELPAGQQVPRRQRTALYPLPRLNNAPLLRSTRASLLAATGNGQHASSQAAALNSGEEGGRIRINLRRQHQRPNYSENDDEEDEEGSFAA